MEIKQFLGKFQFHFDGNEKGEEWHNLKEKKIEIVSKACYS
jgi:hypothetical protein